MHADHGFSHLRNRAEFEDLVQQFNPYHAWLGLDATVVRPTHYQLFRLAPDANNPERIALAADKVIAHVRSQRPGEHAAEWSRLLDELQQAKACLLDPAQRQAYDQSLTALPNQQPAPAFPQNPVVSGASAPTISQAPAAPVPYGYPPVAPAMAPAPQAMPPHAGYPSTPGYSMPYGAGANYPPVTPNPGYAPPNYAPMPPATGWTMPQPMPPNSMQPNPMQPMGYGGAPQNPMSPAPPAGYGWNQPQHMGPPVGPAMAPPVAQSNPMNPMAPAPYAPQGSASSPFAPNPQTPFAQPAAAPYAQVAQASPVPTATPAYATAVAKPVAEASPLSASTGKRIRPRNSTSNMLPVVVVSVLGILAAMVVIIAVIMVSRSEVKRELANQNQIVTPPPEPVKPSPPAPPVVDVPREPTKVIDPPVKPPLPMPPMKQSPPEEMPEKPPMKVVDPDPPKPTPPPEPPKESPPTPEELAALTKETKSALEALGEYNFAAANASFDKLTTLAKLPEHKAKISRLKRTAELAQEFREAMERTIAKLDAGSEIKISSTTVVSVVEVGPNKLILRELGMNKTYTYNDLKMGIAVKLAEMSLPMVDANARLAKGAYVFIDKRPDSSEVTKRDKIKKVEGFWKEAELMGADVIDLMKVLTDTYDFEKDAAKT
jgi:hypothetical protein